MGIHAGQIAKSIGSYMDGGGGGKPHMATAGGKNTDSISNAMNKSELLIRNMLEVDEGDPFNKLLHAKSINNLKARGIFQNVNSEISDSA